MILETIVTTLDHDGDTHIAPLGVHVHEQGFVIAPFAPSRTLDNLRRTPQAAINFTDDARIFAGCLTGRRGWPLVPATHIAPCRLRDALSHCEVEVMAIEEDDVRPRFVCRPIETFTHKAFGGMNRARAAVIEAAILVSRLHMLPRDKVEREIDWLRIAIDKTAGEHEREAWQWLMDRIAKHDRDQAA